MKLLFLIIAIPYSLVYNITGHLELNLFFFKEFLVAVLQTSKERWNTCGTVTQGLLCCVHPCVQFFYFFLFFGSCIRCVFVLLNVWAHTHVLNRSYVHLTLCLDSVGIYVLSSVFSSSNLITWLAFFLGPVLYLHLGLFFWNAIYACWSTQWQVNTPVRLKITNTRLYYVAVFLKVKVCLLM